MRMQVTDAYGQQLNMEICARFEQWGETGPTFDRSRGLEFLLPFCICLFYDNFLITE